MCILAIRDLSIRRNQHTILDKLSWIVRSGEHWVILGPNGSGKTSLLSALCGYFMPTEGSIQLLGEEFGAADWRELRKAVGLVSSSLRQLMHEEDCALEIVAGGEEAQVGYWGPIPRTLRSASIRALERAEAGGLAFRAWGVLSQGERQRVLIARALVHKPSLLILDEPCAGLDPVAREHFLQFVQRLATSSRSPAIILVTHHVEEITPAFTHALLLREGRAVSCGSIEQALTAESLTQTFSVRMRLRRTRGRYSLDVR